MTDAERIRELEAEVAALTAKVVGMKDDFIDLLRELADAKLRAEAQDRRG